MAEPTLYLFDGYNLLHATGHLAGKVGPHGLERARLALLSRAAPALNIFQMGFPVKIMLTLTLLSLTFPLLPPALNTLIEQATRAIVNLKGG